MLTASQEFINILNGYNRDFSFSMVLSNGTTLTDQDLIDEFHIEYSGASQKALKIGEFCKSSITFKVLSNTINWKDLTFNLFVSLSGASDSINLGKFWVNNIAENDGGKTLRITAYNLPSVFNELANPSSTNVSAILTEIETLTGMTIYGKENLTLSTIKAVNESDTWMMLLGYIAGYDGYNIKTKEGNLYLYKYQSVNLNIPEDIIYENGLTVKPNVTIGCYDIRGENNVILQVGSGYALTYSNPYITNISGILDYLNVTYTPLAVIFKGNPLIEIGDIITVTNGENTYTCYVMEHNLSFDGGLKSTISCYADEEMKEVVPIAPTDRKIGVIRNSLNKITNHFWVDDDGVHVTEYENNAETGNNILLTGQGLQIRDNERVNAIFSNNIILDPLIGPKTEINEKGFIIYDVDKINKIFEVISDLDEENVIQENFVGDGVTQRFTLQHPIYIVKSVTINEEIVTNYSFGKDYIRFYDIPINNSQITIQYYSYTEDKYHGTFGSRANVYDPDPSQDLIYGDLSFTFGDSNEAQGKYSFAIGNEASAISDYSFSLGKKNFSFGKYSHAEGNRSIAYKIHSYAKGNYANANGEYSHAEGNHVGASDLQFVFGQYNESDDNAMFILANGSDDGIETTYNNILVVDKSGNETIQGNYKTKKTNKGLYGVDSTDFEYPLIKDNGVNIFIGAEKIASKHHRGKTIISSGYNGTKGNESIEVSIPNATNTGATNYKVLHEGYMPVTESTNFTYKNDCSAYATSGISQPKAYKRCGMVQLKGAIRFSATAQSAAGSVVIGKVPSGFEPIDSVGYVQQGSGQNKFRLVINTSGDIQVERYGIDSNIPIGAGAWLNISCTYMAATI